MSLGSLAFLAEPAFVIPWYAIGVLAAVWVVHDMRTANRHVNEIQWAWPIIVLFFSVLGLLFYLWTSRPPGIAKKEGEEAKKAFEEYAKSPFRKVTGSVIHCVGGDGLGVMTAMVGARLWNMSFWQEYWLEYAVGFAFGWFIFQYKAMSKMADGFSSA